MLTTILLDLDGTLLDSNNAHASAWEEAFKEFDFDKSYQEPDTPPPQRSDCCNTFLLLGLENLPTPFRKSSKQALAGGP